jgi:hypothetical protein
VRLGELSVQFNARPIHCAVQYSLCLFPAIFISRYTCVCIYVYTRRPSAWWVGDVWAHVWLNRRENEFAWVCVYVT